jgi:hypothetical protein
MPTPFTVCAFNISRRDKLNYEVFDDRPDRLLLKLSHDVALFHGKRSGIDASRSVGLYVTTARRG